MQTVTKIKQWVYWSAITEEFVSVGEVKWSFSQFGLRRWTQLCLKRFIPLWIYLPSSNLHRLTVFFPLPLCFLASTFIIQINRICNHLYPSWRLSSSIPPSASHPPVSPLSSFSQRNAVVLFFLSQQLSFSSPVHNKSRQGSRCLLPSDSHMLLCILMRAGKYAAVSEQLSWNGKTGIFGHACWPFSPFILFVEIIF